MHSFLPRAPGRYPWQGTESAEEVWGSGWADTTWGTATVPASPPAGVGAPRESGRATTWAMRATTQTLVQPPPATRLPASDGDAEQTRMG